MKVFLLVLSVLLPFQDESDVLRARVTALLELVVKNTPSKALVYVDEESKDRFLEMFGKGVPSYQLGEVHIKGNEAEVVMKVKRQIPLELSSAGLWIEVPITMNWVRKDGEWLLHVPDFDRLKTPFGTILPPLPPAAPDSNKQNAPNAGAQPQN